jgi:hypothetical protein
MLLQRFYKLLFLAITGAQAKIPTPRIEGVLFPNFVSLMVWTFSTNYSIAMPACQCEHLFRSLSLTWASVESFLKY